MDEIDCKSDCIYKNSSRTDDDDKTEDECDIFTVPTTDGVVKSDAKATDNERHVIDVLENVIATDKTELVKNLQDYETNARVNLKDVSAFESICLRSRSKVGDINHNGDLVKTSIDELDSDTECTTEPSESRSENTVVCDGSRLKSKENATVDVLKSVETSTETLVSENIVCG